MPVYEYACKACDFEFEREQRITDKPVKKCPSCGALKARRLISRTSFVLKGSGWYSDLYAKPSPKGEAKAEGGKADAPEKGAAAEAGSGSGGESAKPAAKEGRAGDSAGGGQKAGPGAKKGEKGSKASKSPPAAA